MKKIVECIKSNNSKFQKHFSNPTQLELYNDGIYDACPLPLICGSNKSLPPIAPIVGIHDTTFRTQTFILLAYSPPVFLILNEVESEFLKLAFW
jgi:hypothetical protein